MTKGTFNEHENFPSFKKKIVSYNEQTISSFDVFLKCIDINYENFVKVNEKLSF